MKPANRKKRAKAVAKRARVMRNPLGAKPQAVDILNAMNRAHLLRAIKREAARQRRAGTPPPMGTLV